MRRVIPLIALLLWGCGGDSTGPSGPSLTGTWRYVANNLAGGGITCSISGMSLQISHTGSSFSGTTSSGTVTCSAPGVAPQSSPFGADVVANGTISGSVVNFDIGDSDWHHTGTLAGGTVSGTATMIVRMTSGNVTMSGGFSLVKQ